MSRTIGITKAIEEIAREFTRLEAEGRPASSAYFFLVGAGISAPQVKLAGAIEQECRGASPEPDAVLPPDVARSPMLRYSHWLQEAHPNRAQRQEYFRGLIEKRAISAANFRLAHLILSGRAPRLVVTPNFDDFLARALTLFGERPIVSDHPETAVRVDPDRTDVQILHVHGTYWFYDCCNLDGEIAARAESGLAYQTVGWRLANILEHRAPIVLGYSGWDQDVIMTSLASRLSAPSGLPYNLYWFCYQRDAIRALPDWLVKHDNVRLVVPDEEERETRDGASAGEGAGASRLRAVTVLDRLNRALGLDEPALTRNPIGFFADHLRESLLVKEGTDGEEDADVYRLQWTIEQLGEMRALWDRRGRRHGAQPEALPLAEVQSAIRRSQHREAIHAAQQIVLAELDAGELAELRETMLLAAFGLFDNSADEIAAYDLVVRAADLRAGRQPGTADASEQRDVATALLYKGLSLDESDEALPVFQEVIDRFDDHVDEDLQVRVIQALRYKAQELRYLEHSDESLATYDLLIERFASHSSAPARSEVARAMLDKGRELDELGRKDEALAVYDELIDGYADKVEGPAQRWVAEALLLRAERLAATGRFDDELSTHDQLLERYAGRSWCAEHVARAMLRKAQRLDELGRAGEALQVLAGLTTRFSDDDDDDVGELAACGLLMRGRILDRAGLTTDALAAYDQLIDRYGETDDHRTRIHVAHGLIDKADRLTALDVRDAAIDAYATVIARHEKESDAELLALVTRARARLAALS